MYCISASDSSRPLSDRQYNLPLLSTFEHHASLLVLTEISLSANVGALHWLTQKQPRSGYVPEPRVAASATLGHSAVKFSNPEGVASFVSTALRLVHLEVSLYPG